MPPEEMKAITGTFNGNTFSCTIDGIPVEMKTKPFEMPELSDEADDKPAFKEFTADIGEFRPGGTYRQLIDKMIGICEHDWARICRLRNEKKFSRARWTDTRRKRKVAALLKGRNFVEQELILSAFHREAHRRHLISDLF